MANRKDKINQYFPDSVTSPGYTLKEKINEMGVGKEEFAKMTGRSVETINAILEGRLSITKEIADGLETATSIPSRFWLNRQSIYDEYMRSINNAQTSASKEHSWMERFHIRPSFG